MAMDDLLSFACLLSFSHRCCGALRGTNRQLLVVLAERTTELRVAPQRPGGTWWWLDGTRGVVKKTSYVLYIYYIYYIYIVMVRNHGDNLF